MSDYTIERGLGVRERMDLLARSHEPGTRALLDLLAVPEDGARCIDLGCGGGHVTFELARRVGPSGHVIAVDLDDELLAISRQDAAARGFHNVEFRTRPVEQVSEEDVDLAYARMLLSHLRDPADMVRRMAASVRPRGMVVVEDVHFAGCFTEPSCRAYDQWITWFKEAVRNTHGDLDIGPRLPALLRDAGLVGVGVRVAQPAFVDGPEKQLQQMSMQKVRSSVLGAGIASADEYDAAYAELKAFTDDPTTIVASPRMVQTWGRRS